MSISSPKKSRRHTHISQKIKKLLYLFQSTEKQVAVFQERSGLHCLNGCGRCCDNPNIETTPAEMLPMAQKIWEEKTLDHWLGRLNDQGSSKICVFYAADPAVAGKGQCLQYSLRPLVCRLYGFSARREKFGSLNLITCPLIKQDQATEVRAAQKRINAGVKAPVMQDVTFKLQSIEPGPQNKTLPINEAFRKALDTIGLHHKLDQ